MRSLLGALSGILNTTRTPVPYVTRTSNLLAALAGYGGPTVDKQLHAMGEIGTVFAMEHRISTAVGAVGWHLYTKAKSGDDEDRTLVDDHPAMTLWNAPNEFYDNNLFVETTMQHLDLTGEAPWVVARAGSNGPPLELWPVRPDRLRPNPHPQRFIDGWTYKNGDVEVPLDNTEVIRLMYPSPWDPYTGLGPIGPILLQLETLKASSEWNRNFFLNSAEPGGIIQVDRRLGEDEFTEMRDRWSDSHKGVTKAHRVAILEQAQWIERKYTQRDMEFATLRQSGRDETREGFGFPKMMLGLVDDVNRANADAGIALFGQWLVVPRCERLKSALNTRLLPMYGKGTERRFEFDYDNPVPADQALDNATLTAKANAAAALVLAGFDPAQTLEAVELPEIGWTGQALQAGGPNPAREDATGQPPGVPGEPALAAMVRAAINGNGHKEGAR